MRGPGARPSLDSGDICGIRPGGVACLTRGSDMSQFFRNGDTPRHEARHVPCEILSFSITETGDVGAVTGEADAEELPAALGVGELVLGVPALLIAGALEVSLEDDEGAHAAAI